MKKLTIIGVLVVSALGTLFHFAYDLIPIFFFPRNESIFEHMKLILFPYLIFLLCYLPFYKEDKKRLIASFIFAIFISIAFTIVAYYTYSGFLGFNVDAVNIIIFYLSIFLGFFFIYKKMTPIGFSNGIIFLLILVVLVVVFSYYPPDLAFFRG